MPRRKTSATGRSTARGDPAPDAPAKVQQTIYLRPELRKRLRIRAAEDDTDLSTIVDRALEAYLGDE